MIEFDIKMADLGLSAMLREHKIEVYAWSKASCGRAYPKKRIIKIPYPTTIDRFAVCAHEVAHIAIQDKKGFRKTWPVYYVEFLCDMYALRKIEEQGWDSFDWVRRTKFHVAVHIAKAVNRGLVVSRIPKDILEFMPEVDFSSWAGKKVYVTAEYAKANDPAEIIVLGGEAVPPPHEVLKMAKALGYTASRSFADDSTYNKIVLNHNEFKDVLYLDNYRQVYSYMVNHQK